jgi:hypothetical protein
VDTPKSLAGRFLHIVRGQSGLTSGFLLDCKEYMLKTLAGVSCCRAVRWYNGVCNCRGKSNGLEAGLSEGNQGPERHFQPADTSGQDGVRILPYDTDDGDPNPRVQARQVTGVAPAQPASSASYLPAVEPSQAPPGARRGPSTCLVMTVTIGLLALSCMVLGFATFQGGLSGLGKLGGLVPSLGMNFAVTPTVSIDTSRPSVIEQVRSLSKLETVHYDLEKVIPGKSSGPLFDFLTSDKILLVAHGEVVAGVDLGTLGPGDIRVEGQQVAITLPKASILYSKLDNDRTYVYDRQTGLFSKPDPNLESRMRVAAEEQIVQAAQEDGILTKARDNARQTIGTLVKGMGYTDVRFQEAP